MAYSPECLDTLHRQTDFIGRTGLRILAGKLGCRIEKSKDGYEHKLVVQTDIEGAAIAYHCDSPNLPFTNLRTKRPKVVAEGELGDAEIEFYLKSWVSLKAGEVRDEIVESEQWPLG